MWAQEVGVCGGLGEWWRGVGAEQSVAKHRGEEGHGDCAAEWSTAADWAT